MIVSHDREFLDRVCTKIVETEFGVATSSPRLGPFGKQSRTWAEEKDITFLDGVCRKRSRRFTRSKHTREELG